ncbi:TPA: hypothetical protein ACGSTL_001411 [Vibrio parahaemolyticus]|uniref:hypothetical protein n=1 Tax=Vibrio campbellii TaxID=680 RepID=UPI001F084A94|nr:hypothetical protein [Vibrio campbellii]UMM06856.1 hypothetical protein MKR81_26710 [Vibrio campbellii]
MQVDKLTVSNNNLFRLSRDVELFTQMLGFLCHQAAHPGTITTPEQAFEYFPSVNKAADLLARALGYQAHSDLIEHAKSAHGTHYPTFLEPGFKDAVTAIVFEEFSNHFQEMPRNPTEREMVMELIDSFCEMVSDEQSRHKEVILGLPCSGKTAYLVQWLEAYARGNQKVTQIPVVVFGMKSLADALYGLHPKLFNTDSVLHIKLDKNIDNFPTSPTGSAITFVEFDPFEAPINGKESTVFMKAQELACSEQMMWALVDEALYLTPISVAFKDSSHNLIAACQQAISPEGQTIYDPKKFIWRFMEPKAFIHYMKQTGIWGETDNTDFVNKMMPKLDKNAALRTGQCLVKGKGIMSLPFKWKDSTLYPSTR